VDRGVPAVSQADARWTGHWSPPSPGGRFTC